MDDKTGLVTRIAGYLRKNGGHIAIEALVNFILPFAIYTYAEAPLGEVRALLASSAPPIAWSMVEFARHRRLDALSVLVVAGIVLSLLAMLGGGGARFLQLREKLVTGVIGVGERGHRSGGLPADRHVRRRSMKAAELRHKRSLQAPRRRPRSRGR